MDDLISRQQAIDAIMGEYPDAHYPDWYASKIRALPSAQPEKRTGKRAETHACDLISRQAAIEAIEAAFPVDPMKSEYTQGLACGVALAKTYVEQLPSAQPYTAEEIDKMQELESAQVEKAYKLGRESAQTEVIHCKECRYFGDLCPWSADQNGFCHKAYKKEELFI